MGEQWLVVVVVVTTTTSTPATGVKYAILVNVSPRTDLTWLAIIK